MSGWAEKPLSALVDVRSSRAVPQPDSDLPYLGMEHVEKESGRILGWGESRVIQSSSPLVEAGVVLYGRLRPYLNKVTVSPRRVYASGEFITMSPGPELLAEFLRWRLASRDFVDFATSLNAGDRPRVKWPQIASFLVSVPSLAEQRRIVDILEDHLSRLDTADNASSLAVQRASLLEASLVAPLIPADAEKFRLHELATGSGYGTSEKCVVGGQGPAVVRIPNVLNGRIDLTDEKRLVSTTTDISSLMLSMGDLLIVRTNGSQALIGRTAVVQLGVEAAFASYLIRYKLDPTRVRPEWISLVLSGPRARAVLEGLAASSAGQYNLSLGKLNTIDLPVPPLADQDRLIRERQSAASDHLSLDPPMNLRSAGLA